MWSTDTERAGTVALTQSTIPSLALSLPCSLRVSLSPRSVSFPRVLETLEVQKAPSHTLTSQHSEFNSICVSRENFSFWSVCIFSAVDSVTHCGLTRKKKTLQRLWHLNIFVRKCRWAILPAITAGVNFLWQVYIVQCAAGSPGTFKMWLLMWLCLLFRMFIQTLFTLCTDTVRN